jgi:uncharacterized membrane-anchored protein YitT (DUF2179 family)
LKLLVECAAELLLHNIPLIAFGLKVMLWKLQLITTLINNWKKNEKLLIEEKTKAEKAFCGFLKGAKEIIKLE